MPMSEWSSDVCSSDPAECRTCTRPIDRLVVGDRHVALTIAGRNQGELWRRRDLCPGKECLQSRIRHIGGKPQALQAGVAAFNIKNELGRASCRVRWCQSV